MTETVQISGNCPACGYTFEKTVSTDEIQTALSEHTNTKDAVQQFCGGDMPLSPGEIGLLISTLSLMLQLHDMSRTNHSSEINLNINLNEDDSEATCPKCGNSDYELDIKQN